MLVACDIYRPAAVEQLCIVGAQAGAPVFKLEGEKPEAIAAKAVAHAKDYGNDIVILDTAGRLHVDEELMEELQRIKQAVAVDETLLVIDAMAGQDAVNVAKAFGESTGLDGVILTKLDGDTRGGSALSVRAVTGKPIKFAGVGEKLDDLEPFYPDRMASRILGMGDVLTLIEKAQSTADAKEAEKTARRMLENKFDMNDMLAQFQQLKKMGGAGAHALHDAGRFRQGGCGRAGKLKRNGAHRGYHPQHDSGRARKAFHHQPQAQAPHRSRFRHARWRM